MSLRGKAVLAIFSLALALGFGCNNSSTTSAPPRSSNLAITAASPTNGNAILRNPAVLSPGVPTSGTDELRLSQLVAGVLHQVTIDWDDSTTDVLAVNHTWAPPHGPIAGITLCTAGTATPCDASAIVVDTTHRTVSLSGVTLGNTTRPDTSTLDGTIVW